MVVPVVLAGRTAGKTGGQAEGKDSLTLQPCISDTAHAKRSSWPESECFSVTGVFRQGRQRRRSRFG
jgi:predicted P-loop ATPase